MRATRASAFGLVLACVAACSHNSMVIEVVTSDPQVARVELVLVESHCDSCTGDAPPSSLTKATGDVYYQLAGDRFTAPVSAGVAGFTLEPGADSDEILRLGAIGFDAQGIPKGIALIDQDIHIKQHLGEVFRVDLTSRDIQPAVGPLPGFTINPNDTVIVWRAPNAPDTTASCIAVLGAANTFVVPHDDPDCDGITGAAECDPFWYEYAKPANTTTPQYCLEQQSSIHPCTIGTEVGCVDGQSQEGCHPDNYCMPERACVDCNDPTDPQCTDKVGTDSNGVVPRIHCLVPLVGVQGNYVSCTTGIAAINFDAQFTTPSACEPGLIKPILTLPPAPMSSLAVDTGQGPVTFTIANPMAPCTFQIIPIATVSNIPSRSVPAMVVLHGPTRELILPLVVDFTSAGQTGCSGTATAVSCTVDASAFADPMWTCASQ